MYSFKCQGARDASTSSATGEAGARLNDLLPKRISLEHGSYVLGITFYVKNGYAERFNCPLPLTPNP